MPNVLTKTESAAVRGAVFDEIQAVEDDRRSIIPRTAGDKRLQHRADLGHGGWRFLQTEPLVLRFHTHPVMLWVLQVCCSSIRLKPGSEAKRGGAELKRRLAACRSSSAPRCCGRPTLRFRGWLPRAAGRAAGTTIRRTSS